MMCPVPAPCLCALPVCCACVLCLCCACVLCMCCACVLCLCCAWLLYLFAVWATRCIADVRAPLSLYSPSLSLLPTELLGCALPSALPGAGGAASLLAVLTEPGTIATATVFYYSIILHGVLTAFSALSPPALACDLRFAVPMHALIGDSVRSGVIPNPRPCMLGTLSMHAWYFPCMLVLSLCPFRPL